jgi:hypothetical protein
MATPANNAAVLSNSFFLMEWSSSSRFHPVRPIDIGPWGTTLDYAQFRLRALYFGATPLGSHRFVWNKISNASSELRLVASMQT